MAPPRPHEADPDTPSEGEENRCTMPPGKVALLFSGLEDLARLENSLAQRLWKEGEAIPKFERFLADQAKSIDPKSPPETSD